VVSCDVAILVVDLGLPFVPGWTRVTRSRQAPKKNDLSDNSERCGNDAEIVVTGPPKQHGTRNSEDQWRGNPEDNPHPSAQHQYEPQGEADEKE